MAEVENGRKELTERLRKEGWYLGDMTSDAADSILMTGGQANTFLVYSSLSTGGYTISARFRVEVEDSSEDITEHLEIRVTEDGQFQLSGQEGTCPDVIELVNRYVMSREPPLLPALKRSIETQISIPDEPPDYDRANKTLQPDIAPLPNISGVKVESPKEAEAGNISPSSSLRQHHRAGRDRNQPSYVSRSVWRRYLHHSPCHPKNCCYACCYRPVYWNGYRLVNRRKWYDPRGSGCLRVIGILLFLLFCGLCFCCCKFCLFCCQFFLYICFYDDDD